jgi:hypothetical protein
MIAVMGFFVALPTSVLAITLVTTGSWKFVLLMAAVSIAWSVFFYAWLFWIADMWSFIGPEVGVPACIVAFVPPGIGMLAIVVHARRLRADRRRTADTDSN